MNPEDILTSFAAFAIYGFGYVGYSLRFAPSSDTTGSFHRPLFAVFPAVREYLPDTARGRPRMVAIGPTIANFLVQLLNVTGGVWEPGFLAYLFGLFVYRFSSGLLFDYVILFGPPVE